MAALGNEYTFLSDCPEALSRLTLSWKGLFTFLSPPSRNPHLSGKSTWVLSGGGGNDNLAKKSFPLSIKNFPLHTYIPNEAFSVECGSEGFQGPLGLPGWVGSLCRVHFCRNAGHTKKGS